MNVLSLFDGISCGQQALKNLGIKFENYFSSEIDQKSISVTQKNFPNTIQLGSVETIDVGQLPKIDLIMGGSPCQGFSIAGNRKGFQDPRSKLFFEFVRIKKQLDADYFLLENNRMKDEYLDVITRELGVSPHLINASLLTTQNRVRNYWTDIDIGEITDSGLVLSSIIGEYKGIWVYPRGNNKGGVKPYKGKCPTITTSSWEHNFKIARSENELEKFTPEQCEQIQGLPIGYTSGLSVSQRIKKIGNGWSVPVIEHLLKPLV